MTDPQAILLGILREHHPKPIWCKCGWAPGLSLNDTESDRNQTYWHVATLQAAALAEWLRSEVAVLVATNGVLDLDAEGSGQPHRASEYAVAALCALADEFGATP